MFPGKFSDQTDDFAGFGMTPGLEFGVDQLPIYTYLVPASIGWDESHTFDLRFKIFEKFIY